MLTTILGWLTGYPILAYGVWLQIGLALVALAFMGELKWPVAVTWGVRLGLLAFTVGSLEGQPMVNNGGHTVGAPDGVPGLPFLNWSKAFGDWRIAHFFGVHSLQAFPLLGLLISHTSLSQHFQVGGVVAGAVVYAAMVWLMYRQAMAGRPLVHA